MSEKWPEEIRGRNKQGFGSPVSEWLKNPDLVILKNQIMKDKKSRIYDILDFEVVQNFVSKDNYQTWILFNLALWLEKHPVKIT